MSHGHEDPPRSRPPLRKYCKLSKNIQFPECTWGGECGSV